MIYHTFINQASLEVKIPVETQVKTKNPTEGEIDSSKQIQPAKSKIYACLTEFARWKTTPGGDKEQPIYGLIPFEQLSIFKDDPDGLPRLEQYTEKLLQNLYTFSSELNRRRRLSEIIKKIS